MRSARLQLARRAHRVFAAARDRDLVAQRLRGAWQAGSERRA